MTCKACIHEKVCKYKRYQAPLSDVLYEESDHVERSGCPFADKSKFIELPCKLNDLFYIIPTENNGFDEITRVECLGFQISKPEPVVDLFRKENGKSSRLYQAGFNMFGESIFRAREEAEKALKERDNNESKHNESNNNSDMR